MKSAKFGALIMAGGLGSRMGHLTHDTPKPLLSIGNSPLIDCTLGALFQAGISSENIFVRVNYLGQQIKAHLNDLSCKVLSDSEESIASSLYYWLPELPDDFLALSADLIGPYIFKKVIAMHSDNDVAASLLLGNVPEEQRQKNWQYIIHNERLTDLKTSEGKGALEKLALIFSKTYLEFIRSNVVEHFRNPQEKYLPVKDGWHLILRILLDKNLPVRVQVEDNYPAFNVNRPDHLKQAMMALKYLDIHPLKH